jgi:hypothetical protein
MNDAKHRETPKTDVTDVAAQRKLPEAGVDHEGEPERRRVRAGPLGERPQNDRPQASQGDQAEARVTLSSRPGAYSK